jgi:hypothetical protein
VATEIGGTISPAGESAGTSSALLRHDQPGRRIGWHFFGSESAGTSSGRRIGWHFFGRIGWHFFGPGPRRRGGLVDRALKHLGD